jgi:cytochrome c-type biogenesis protein CcmF
MIVGSLALVVSRRDTLRSEHRLDSLLSREAMFLGNNVVLVGLAFVVFWGTFFPLISEALTGNKQSLGPPWYDKYTVPLALVLVLLSGIGPVIAWRRATAANARRNFRWPMAAGLVTLLALVPFGVAGRPAAWLMFGFGAFVVGTVAQEFARGVRARRAMTSEAVPAALVTLVRRNRRRYGGYIIHLGMAVMFIGVAASSAFQHARDVRLAPGQTARVGNGYLVRYERATSRLDLAHGTVERLVFGAQVGLYKDGRRVATLRPERGYYPIQGAPFAGALGRYFEGEATSEVAMDAGVRRDVWTAVQPDTSRLLPVVKKGDEVFRAAMTKLPPNEFRASLGQAIRGLVDNYPATAPPATFRLIVSPLVAWIWLGALCVIFGGVVCLWPAPDLAHRRARAGYAARVARELGRA